MKMTETKEETRSESSGFLGLCTTSYKVTVPNHEAINANLRMTQEKERSAANAEKQQALNKEAARK